MDVPSTQAEVTGRIEMVPVPTTGAGAYSMEDEGSEWEYEYEEVETEDFYFTLDLTTHVPNAVLPAKVSRNRKKLQRDADKAREVNEIGANPVRAPGAGGWDGAQPPKPPGKLQVLDLHSHEPIVRFNDEVFKCQWHTDLGTQFHVSQIGATAKPRHAGNVLDVVGVSRVRLLGRPVTLRQRSDWVDERNAASEGNAEAQAAAAESRSVPKDLSGLRPGQQLVVPRNLINNPNMEAQASFFERLSAIKLKKGEKDLIPVGGVRQYQLPVTPEEVRERSPTTIGAQEPHSTETQNASTEPSGSGEPAATSLPIAEEPASTTSTKPRRKRTFAELGKETKADKAKRAQIERQADVEASLAAQTPPTARPVGVPTRIDRLSTPTSVSPSIGIDSSVSGPSFVRGTPRLAAPGEGTRPPVPSRTLVQYSTPSFGRPTSSLDRDGGYISPAIPWHLLPAPSQSPEGDARRRNGEG